MYAATSWGYRHPYICTGVRIAGTWNLVLGSLLLSHGYRWGVALFAVAALIFWVAWSRWIAWSRIPDYVHRGVRVRGRR
jgi:hypothetical protein